MNRAVLLPVVTALIGAAIGGLVAELRQWLQISRDNRRVLNRVLFVQLDVWDTIRRADPDTAMNDLPRILAKVFSVPEPEVRQVFQGHPATLQFIRQILATATPTGVDNQYREAVDRLADVQPLLAYRISTRPGLDALLTSWRAKAEEYLSTISEPEDNRKFLDTFQPALESESRAIRLKRLEDDIADVAGAIGWRRERQVRLLLNRAKQTKDHDDDEMVAKMRDVFIKAGFLSPAS